jgi:hypothetical protein
VLALLAAGALVDDDGGVVSNNVTLSGLLGALSLLPALSVATV